MPAIDPKLLVGPETLDDAAALKVSEDIAVCFTADFITPLVDDPRQWGLIAAANSISDIYAMGARPLAALNLVCWPNCLPLEMLGEVMAGGAQAALGKRRALFQALMGGCRRRQLTLVKRLWVRCNINLL